jgi:hypothetical protein
LLIGTTSIDIQNNHRHRHKTYTTLCRIQSYTPKHCATSPIKLTLPQLVRIDPSASTASVFVSGRCVIRPTSHSYRQKRPGRTESDTPRLPLCMLRRVRTEYIANYHASTIYAKSYVRTRTRTLPSPVRPSLFHTTEQVLGTPKL